MKEYKDTDTDNEEEEKYNKEYEIYDENDIPLNNYKEKIYKKSAVKQTKGKGKFKKKIDLRDCLNTYYCKCGKCLMNQIYSDDFDKMHSKSLFDFSSLLKEYKKYSKIFNDKNFFPFFIDKKKFKIKLIYKASENKFLIKSLIKNIKSNETKNKIGLFIIIKFSNDLYFAFLDSLSLFILYGFVCFFTVDEIKYCQRFSKFFNFYDDGIITKANFSKNYISMNIRDKTEKNNCIPYFSFTNSLSEVTFNRTIKLKHRIIMKNSTFSVVDFECFNIDYLNN